ncbi:hypothetical protein [Arcobacter vandammei]|uniref:hypothetical protein n=1 Tax=Arcobacter vandammei TaxID=2782243 RepID=UPI0018DEF818|nr:hypothetical protein [Arcobacter vandammei]
MNKIYGSFIIFFYFLKYPILIYLAICYYKGFEAGIVMNILGIISIILVFKDIFFRKKK